MTFYRTVRNADVIAVVTNGMICDQGKHEELLEKSKVYNQLVKRQLNWGKKGASQEDDDITD
jgi:ABC-type multidrug transport system fused ATPase/permease subunit